MIKKSTFTLVVTIFLAAQGTVDALQAYIENHSKMTIWLVRIDDCTFPKFQDREKNIEEKECITEIKLIPGAKKIVGFFTDANFGYAKRVQERWGFTDETSNPLYRITHGKKKRIETFCVDDLRPFIAPRERLNDRQAIRIVITDDPAERFSGFYYFESFE